MIKYIIIYLLNLIDYFTTIYCTNLYGIETEINPLMRSALSEPWKFAFIKIILFPIFLYWVWKKKHDDTAWMTLGMFIVVVLMNIYTILTLNML